jgi:NAD(P)-dependent dehydrogenase (short-subunit alcohol dehydrogenase family)
MQEIVIAGASSAIGKATAGHFAKQGWNVVATMHSPKVSAELAGDHVFIARLDLLDSESIQSAVSAALERFGGIDVLVNNAGSGAYGPLEATPMSVDDHVLSPPGLVTTPNCRIMAYELRLLNPVCGASRHRVLLTRRMTV